MTDMGTGNDSFHRWQRIAIDQLGYSLNLILTLTVAALGYWFVLVTDKEFNPGHSAKCIMIFSLLTLFLSAFAGLACVVNRLHDFRGTAKRAHGTSSRDTPTREQLDGLGRATWTLFYLHLGSFAAGVTLLGVAILLTYGEKLV